MNKTSEGAALVLAVFIRVGAENAAFVPVTESLDELDEVLVDLEALLPKSDS